ncbi:MAG: hypothetical protein P8180_07465 [Gammaproteobacteria bacterium]|jgi:hypothetical protein
MDREAPFRAVGRVHLIPALAVKLTVTEDRSPERITHAIRVALVPRLSAPSCG